MAAMRITVHTAGKGSDAVKRTMEKEAVTTKGETRVVAGVKVKASMLGTSLLNLHVHSTKPSLIGTTALIKRQKGQRFIKHASRKGLTLTSDSGELKLSV